MIGLTPCQEPRCFAWYSRRAFLLRLSNGTNCVTADHLLLFVLVWSPQRAQHSNRWLIYGWHRGCSDRRLFYNNLITNGKDRLLFQNISGMLKYSAEAEIILMNGGDPYVHDSVSCHRSCGYRGEYLPAPEGSRPDSPRSPALFRI